MRLLTNLISKPELALAYEEAICLARLQEKTPDTIWLWKHPSVIYLMNNSSLNFLDTNYIKELGVPVVRSAIFEGRPTSAIIAGTDWGLLYAGKEDLGDLFSFNEEFWKSFLPLELKNNDLIIPQTDRKISGMVRQKKGDVFFGHNTFLDTKPQIDFNRLFKVPTDKFENKTVASPSERVTSYYDETSKNLNINELVEALQVVLAKRGIPLEPGDFTAEELALVEQLSEKHQLEEWIKYATAYAKPDFI